MAYGGHSGSIPAYAGEAIPAGCGRTRHRVDPRVRGGGATHRHKGHDIWGRSPRTRGRQVHSVLSEPSRGSIPAYAGEAIRSKCRTMRARVDPRVRGGGTHPDEPLRGNTGRSPRTRGRQEAAAMLEALGGSIPAYAGEATVTDESTKSPQVDPRVRGGGLTLAVRLATVTGRSPRTRGRHWCAKMKTPVFRSIPAYAGEAQPGSISSAFDRVDPRVRGGGKSTFLKGKNHAGRSPRTRGRP